MFVKSDHLTFDLLSLSHKPVSLLGAFVFEERIETIQSEFTLVCCVYNGVALFCFHSGVVLIS